MRLLQLDARGEPTLTDNLIRDIPAYAILSHTWGLDVEEVTFQQLNEGSGKSKAGYQKIVFCGAKAKSDGLEYFWVDTCCIDKTSSAELTEAINSMFDWYRNAQKCYVYLTDVIKSHSDDDSNQLSRSGWHTSFRSSRYFTRGWTLQELLAPLKVEFFSSNEQWLGDKHSLEAIVHEITRIPLRALQGCPLSEFSINERISWSNSRATARAEDMAYSLLGILGVHMSLIYGEGKNSAIRRLRQETSRNHEASSDSLPLPQVYRAIHFPRNPEFVQRSVIFEQIQRLLPPRSDYQSAALLGLGGSGKTQLALEYAYGRCSDPSCSVFWVHADTETSFAQDYKLIATKLGLKEDLEGDKLLTAVRLQIETLTQWVLVLDNADDLTLFGVGRGRTLETSHRPNLAVYVPRGPTGTVLWTSRDQHIQGSLVGPQHGVKVVGMTDIEAETLFQAIAVLDVREESKQHDALNELLVELGWLPLAITQAAAYIRRTRTPLIEYLDNIRQRRKRWRLLKKSEHDRYRRPEMSSSTLETWNISMEYIKKENRMAYDILTTVAYVDNQNIPFEMLVAFAEVHMGKNNRVVSVKRNAEDSVSISSSESSAASESEHDYDELDILEAVTRLEEFSFLTLRTSHVDSKGRVRGSYDMHKLVQEAVLCNLHTQQVKALGARLSLIALRTTQNLFPSERHWKIWGQCEQYLGHANKSVEWLHLHGDVENAVKLLYQVANFLHDHGRWREEESMLSTMFKLQKKTLGLKHNDTLWTMTTLGMTYRQQGKCDEAEKIHTEVLQLQRDLVGDEHLDTVWTITELAATYHQQGKSLNKVKEMFTEVLRLRREIQGNIHPNTLLSMAHLALMYQIEHQNDEAEKMHTEVLKLRREVLGDKHPQTIWSKANLATTYYQQQRYDEAEELYIEALALQREMLGDKHPDTIQSIANLAAAHYARKKYKGAEKRYAEALKLKREQLGDKDPNTTRYKYCLATTLFQQHIYDSAEKLYAEVLGLRRETLGDHHPDTIRTMGRLAITYYQQNLYDKAQETYIEILQLQRKVLGEEHADTVRSLMQLARVYSIQGKHTEAEKLQLLGLEVRRELLGDSHPSTIWSMGQLAMTYFRLLRYTDAERLQVEILRLRKGLLGSENAHTAQYMVNLARIFYRQHRFEEADDILSKTVKLQRESLGEEHRDTVVTMKLLEAIRNAPKAIADEEYSEVLTE